MRIEKHQANLIGHNISARTTDQAKLMEKLATGKALNRASDDAAGMAMAKEFEKQVRMYRNASENVSAGMSAMSIADGGASTISDMLQRQNELAIQSSNGILNDDQRGSINNEFKSLSQEIDRISKSTDFNGQKLLDGSSALSNGTGKIQAGDSSASQINLPAANLSSSSLSLNSEDLSTAGGAQKAMFTIDAAMKKVSATRASQGGLQNQLQSEYSNIQSQLVNTTKGLSQIEDLDYAHALTQKASNDILINTGNASLAQFNQLSRTHLLALLQ